MGNVVIYSKELIIQIHKTTVVLSDDILRSTGLLKALYLKSAYLQEDTSRSFHLQKIPL